MGTFDPQYTVQPFTDVSVCLFTAGSKGLWIVDVVPLAGGSGFDVGRVSAMTDDGVPIAITPLREGTPAALSSCVTNPTDFTLSAYVVQLITPPSLQFKRFYPIYVAPGSIVFTSSGSNIYLSEG